MKLGRRPWTCRHWVDDLEPGDVIITNNGTLRTILEVFKRERTKRIVSVTCAILHCSWTKRPHTHVDRWTMRTSWKRKVGHWSTFKRSAMVRKILAERSLCGDERGLFCCDVIGVFS